MSKMPLMQRKCVGGHQKFTENQELQIPFDEWLNNIKQL
jgi:hypothetical protein